MTMASRSDFSEEIRRRRDYVEALEEERRKILVFHRELPLSLQLVHQTIESCKQQLSERSEQTSGEAPPFEEFIPIRRKSDGEEHESDKLETDDGDEGKNSRKSDWIRSVQLWNQTSDLLTTEVKRNESNGGFHLLKKNKIENTVKAAAAYESAVAEAGTEDKEDGQAQRKARRRWSPELHRRFLHALHQLGGSHVATPKQIRELMKVEGLTNNEVKSHLQKYRLHTKRPNPTNENTSTATQTPQFVVVGGIWVPMASTRDSTDVAGAISNRIYPPIATLPTGFQCSAPTKPMPHKPLVSGIGIRSHSPTSSSTSLHTATSSADY